MPVDEQTKPAAAAPSPATADQPVGRRRWRTDLFAAVLSIAGALWITSGAWADPTERVIQHNRGDQAFFEWLLAYAAHSVTHWHDPLWTDLLNVPDGVNLGVNTSVTVLGVLLAPITLTAGPSVAFVTALTLNLAATSFCWYLLLSRRLVSSPTAAIVGGLICGFGPGLVSHATGHLNFTAQFLIPLILWQVTSLTQPGRALRRGTLLGVLVAVQYSLGAEVLFFTALACAVFLLAYWLCGHREPAANLAAMARALGATTIVAAVLLAYPLWLNFFGPQRYHGTGFDRRIHSEDLLAYGAFPRLSLAGLLGLDSGLAPNPTEENSFFGLPLLIATVILVVALHRRATAQRRILVRALTITAVVFAVLSLGPRLKFNGVITDVPLPYAALSHMPIFDAALPARLALIVLPIVGILVALGIEAYGRPLTRKRWWVPVAFAVALLPLVPTPVQTITRTPVPHFISAGTWRQYVAPGETLVPVPPTSDVYPDGQRWQAEALSTADGGTFRIPAGFFLGPGGPDGTGRIGPVPRPTYALLTLVAQTGVQPAIGSAEQAQARVDLRYWNASVVVLPDSGGQGNNWSRNHPALLATLNALFGEGVHVDDVWVWRV